MNEAIKRELEDPDTLMLVRFNHEETQRTQKGGGLSVERMASLKRMLSTSVDDFKVSVRCGEINGHFLSVEECEFLLELCCSESLKKFIAGKARKAFRDSVRGEVVDNDLAKRVAAGEPVPVDEVNYSTLRKALYLCPSVSGPDFMSDRIRSLIERAFPWGSSK